MSHCNKCRCQALNENVEEKSRTALRRAKDTDNSNMIDAGSLHVEDTSAPSVDAETGAPSGARQKNAHMGADIQRLSCLLQPRLMKACCAILISTACVTDELIWRALVAEPS